MHSKFYVTQYINGKAFYGIKTGLTEAFVIDQATKDRLIVENARSADVIKPFLAGRDIERYNTLCAEKYLIFFPKGWTRKNTNEKDESSNWHWLSGNYPAIVNYLTPFADRARNRSDKGEFWWELRACDYYDEFEELKIMYQVLQVQPCFI